MLLYDEGAVGGGERRKVVQLPSLGDATAFLLKRRTCIWREGRRKCHTAVVMLAVGYHLGSGKATCVCGKLELRKSNPWGKVKVLVG